MALAATTIRRRAVKYFAVGSAAAVGLGTGGSWAAYRYFVTHDAAQREARAAGKPAAPSSPAGPPAWPLVAAAATTFSVGALGGLAMGLGNRGKQAVHAEAAMLGAKAFVIATGLVGALGVAIVGTIRVGLGIGSIRDFGILIRGAPVVLEDEDAWDGADVRHDYTNGRLRLDSGLEIMYDLLHYSGSLGAEPAELDRQDDQAAPKAGPQPVVLLHGLCGNRETMREALAPALTAAGHAVLLADQRGGKGGATSTRGQRKVWWRWQPGSAGDAADSEGLSVGVLAEDTITLLDKLHLPAVHLVGCSIGGLVAEELALRHPERVLSVTLAALDASPVPRAEDTAARLTPAEGGGEPAAFCPLDPTQPEHWAAARAAAAAAYAPASTPRSPVTLVLPPGADPPQVLRLPHASRHVTARVVRSAPRSENPHARLPVDNEAKAEVAALVGSGLCALLK